ncbi:hypothetical protein D3C78_1028750 [compost metagenome]
MIEHAVKQHILKQCAKAEGPAKISGIYVKRQVQDYCNGVQPSDMRGKTQQLLAILLLVSCQPLEEKIPRSDKEERNGETGSNARQYKIRILTVRQ